MSNQELLNKIGQSTEETEFYTPMPPGYRRITETVLAPAQSTARLAGMSHTTILTGFVNV